MRGDATRRTSASTGRSRRASGTAPLRALFALVLVQLGGLAFLAAPAAAGTGVSHPHLFAVTGGGLESASWRLGIAVDEANGILYAYSMTSSKGRVDRFDASTGAFLSSLSPEETPQSFEFPTGGQSSIAVDNSGTATTGNVYFSVFDAKTNRGLVYVFDSAGKYLRQLDGSNTPTGFFVGQPPRLTVDSLGNLHVVEGSDVNLPAILKFDSSGEFLSTLEKPEIVSPFPYSLALDSTNALYVANFCGQGLVKFSPGGVFQGTIDTDAPGYVAVDTSTDDVYLSSGGLYLSQYDSTGTLLGKFGSAHATTSGACGGGPLAVDSSSNRIFAQNNGTIDVFGSGEPATTPDVTIAPATEVGFYTATLHGTVDPNGEPTSYRFQYDGDADIQHVHSFTPVESAGSGTEPVEVSAEVPLTDPLFHSGEFTYRLIATNTDADVTELTGRESFTTDTPPPPTIDPPTEVTSTSAQVSGSVNPQGLETDWSFNIGGLSGNAGSGTEDVPVSGELTDLEPNTTYTLALTAKNKGGSVTSEPVEFTTEPEKPVAATVPAGCLKTTSACLGATIDPRKSPTTYYFEYGVDETYGDFAPAGKDGDAGAGLGLQKLTAELEDLDPSTVYHYRVVAENQAGKVMSPDATLQTAAATSPFGPDWPPRGFELVSSPDKGNQSLFPLRPISSDGDRVLWTTTAGGPGTSTGFGASYLSIREADGWTQKTIDPAAVEPIGGNDVSTFEVKYASPKLDSFIIQPKAGFIENTLPGALLRIDDQGSQEQIGAVFPGTFQIKNDELYATSDATHAVLRNPEGSPGLVEFYSGGAKSLDLPSCAFQFPARASSPGNPSYRWMASTKAVVFVQSAGDGSCDAPTAVYRIDGASGDVDLISGAHTVAAHFGRTNADGSAALYLKGGEFYRWELDTGSVCLTCSTGGTEALRGPLLATRDLQTIYFRSPKVLVDGVGLPGLPCADPKSGVALSCNTYIWHDGQVGFVAISGTPYGRLPLDGGNGETDFMHDAIVTPSGDTLVFLSDNPHSSADPNGGTTQLYRYDRDSQRTACISCSGTSDPPVGGPDGDLNNASGKPNLHPFAVSADGRTIAFSTTASLLPKDVNGTRDVYEWHDGALRLITDGISEIPDSSAGLPTVWGLSPDGRNLVFAQRGRLVGNESDALTNLFNARVGGGTVLAAPPAPCVEDACQGPLQEVPAFATAASSSVVGPGSQRNSKRKASRAKKKKRRRAARRRAARRRAAKKRHKHKAKRTRVKGADRSRNGKGEGR